MHKKKPTLFPDIKDTSRFDLKTEIMYDKSIKKIDDENGKHMKIMKQFQVKGLSTLDSIRVTPVFEISEIHQTL
jgi:uncharacterized protein YlaN (UPF0358 family)